MAPTALKRLIALQIAREGEMSSMRQRLMAKRRDTLNKNIVQSRLDSLKEIWNEARRTHSDIIGREDAETDTYVVEEVFGRIQGVYEDALDEFLTLFTLFEKADETTLPAGAADASFLGLGEPGVAKLPRIPLPTFSGKYEDWASFCDLFTTLVHDVPRLSDATKLQYLKLCLTGKAADLIRDVTTTSANYVSTWRALKARFHNPRLIINKHLSSLMDIPHVKKESASDLRSFLDEAQRIVRALQNLKLPVEHWDVWLVFVLSERLDSESRKLWEAELSQRDSEIETGENSVDGDFSKALPKYSDLVRFLEKRAQALNMITSERRGEKRPSSTFTAGPQSRKVFHASSSRPTKADGSKCPLCSGSHSLKSDSRKVFQIKG